jgi:hypothetical protein
VEGREAHRLEEAARRDRRAHERVGDHRIQEEWGRLQVRASAAFQAVVEASNASIPVKVVPASDPAPAGSRELCDAIDTELGETLVVAWPELLQSTSMRLGTETRCPNCGRRGRITRVVSLDEWRKSLRYRLG